MEESRVAPGVRCHQLFHGESRVVEQGPVRVKASAICAEDDDRLGYSVDDASQLLLRGIEFCKRWLREFLDLHSLGPHGFGRREGLEYLVSPGGRVDNGSGIPPRGAEDNGVRLSSRFQVAFFHIVVDYFATFNPTVAVGMS
jgi:hypothetical protein